MGHKVNPNSIRLKITDTWRSKWFSQHNFASFLEQDIKIREFLESKFKKSGISRVEIERHTDGAPAIIIKTSKPGLVIGTGGSGVEELKKTLKAKFKIKTELRISVEGIDDRLINLQSQIIANNIVEQLERRVAFRRLMKQTLETVMAAGAKGVKVSIGGRLNGAEIARTESLSSGKIPLHTLRADIDFARSTAHTTYGTLGVKVWIYRGDIF